MEIDAYKQLPASVYSMLYSVATASADDISALRAWEVLIALLTRHSGERASFLSCTPKPEELCNAWDKFGRHRVVVVMNRVCCEWRTGSEPVDSEPS